ncbi:hypothetical protein L2E82_35340 [Cichorium intybus]|uniref:Uncharacterized protein n=1 Tax=Cichorium intybus TaxID=13427 RepID=A0ACB9BNQ3_CICIN|nr:hypothetical protein L2E82_35340 [Cichorium intybus]
MTALRREEARSNAYRPRSGPVNQYRSNAVAAQANKKQGIHRHSGGYSPPPFSLTHLPIIIKLFGTFSHTQNTNIGFFRISYSLKQSGKHRQKCPKMVSEFFFYYYYWTSY